MQFDVVILAGGQGARMGFKDKGLLNFNGKKLISIISNLAYKNSQKVIISCNDNFDKYQKYGKTIADSYPNFAGPLAGISSALTLVQSEYLLVLAVDTPKINQKIIDKLVNAMDNTINICVAFDGIKIHPTIMLLRVKLKDDIDKFLFSGGRKLGLWINQNSHKKVLVDDINLLENINFSTQL